MRNSWIIGGISLVILLVAPGHQLDSAKGTLSHVTSSDSTALSPVWAPDGRRIAFTAGPDIGFVGGGNAAKAGAAQRRIWVMDSGGANLRQLTHHSAYRDERPRWSSDGSHILFARVNAAGDQASLWLIDESGGQPIVVADGLSWSSKGEPLWFGYYGHIDWDRFYDWWPGVVNVTPRPWDGSMYHCTPSQASSPPCGLGAAVGSSYPYQLYTHCGIIWAYFDGRWWKTSPVLDDGHGNPPPGWDNPYDSGRMALVNANLARYTAASGAIAEFAPLPEEGQAYPGKVCG